MSDTGIVLHLRLPQELYERLKEEHARTYPEHRMIWAAWLRARLDTIRVTEKPVST